MYFFVVMMSLVVMKVQGAGRINSVYQVQYLYSATSAYLEGLTPTLLIWLYVTLSGAVVVGFAVATRPPPLPQRVQLVNRLDDSSREMYPNEKVCNLDSITSVAVGIVVSVVASALAIAINYGFVHIVYFRNPPNLTAVNLAFAVIKSVLNTIVVPYLTKLLPRESRQLQTVLITIMVNVVSPGLAVLISSPLCLFDYIHKKSISVNYQYPLEKCVIVSSYIICKPYLALGQSEINPQWFYSYQCSSSYLVSYLPNFIYLYIITGILTPVLNLLVMVLSSSRTRVTLIQLNRRQEQSLVSTINFVLQIIGDKFRVGSLFYIRGSNDTLDSSDVSTFANPSSVEMSVVDKSSRKDIDYTITSRITTVSVDPSSSEDYDIEVAELMPSLCVDVTMMLTFGLASPLFAVMVACSIITNTLLWRLALGRYITIVSKATCSRVCYEKLERAFDDEWRCLLRSWPMMSVFIGLFWSLFVNDMIGSKSPTGGIVAAVMIMTWCPLVFMFLQWLLSVDPNSARDSSSMLRSIREHAHSISSKVHYIIWKHILRLDSTSSSSGINSDASTINETISPLGSINTTTNTTSTATNATMI